MAYVDAFVLPVPKDNLEAYKEIARTAGAVWREHGARDYVECLPDDVPAGKVTSFPLSVQAKEDEIVIFSYVTYDTREHRDQVMAKVMADERLKASMENMPFDGKRMFWGGFKPFIELR